MFPGTPLDGDEGTMSGSNKSLAVLALEVLNTPDPVEKARLGDDIAKRWLQGDISLPFRDDEDLPVPDRPSRLSNVHLSSSLPLSLTPTANIQLTSLLFYLLTQVNLVSPSLMPKLGKGGNLHSRQAMLHSLVHTESWAIDLSWDIIARFGRKESMPRDFFTDFVKVAQDEGRHFNLLVKQLEEIGSYYGAFLAHDGLWDSAIQTSGDLSARLAIEHCVHEVE